MNVLKAYAHRVVSYHPKKQRDDLYAEILDELCEEFRDRQAQDPNLDETDFLNRFKQHPMRYATQLATDSSAYLIGPQFYFSFISALKVSLAIVVAFHVVVALTAGFLSGNIWNTLWGAAWSIPLSCLWVAATVLGVFVALERSGERATWLDKWDAAELNPSADHQSISLLETSFDIGVSTFALLLVLDILQFPMVIRHDGEWIQGWSINLPEGFWLDAGLLLLFGIGFSLYRLSRTVWTNRLRVIEIVVNLMWISLLAAAASQSGLLSIEHPLAEELAPMVENATKIALLVACFIIAWDTITHGWRLYRNKSHY